MSLRREFEDNMRKFTPMSVREVSDQSLTTTVLCNFVWRERAHDDCCVRVWRRPLRVWSRRSDRFSSAVPFSKKKSTTATPSSPQPPPSHNRHTLAYLPTLKTRTWNWAITRALCHHRWVANLSWRNVHNQYDYHASTVLRSLYKLNFSVLAAAVFIAYCSGSITFLPPLLKDTSVHVFYFAQIFYSTKLPTMLLFMNYKSVIFLKKRRAFSIKTKLL